MSDLKPAFIDAFEKAHQTLQTLGAQDPRPLPKDAAPETKQIFYAELWERYVRTVSLVRDAAKEMGHGLETIKDLQLSKEPDIERFALLRWASGVERTPQDAFKAAENFVQLRNARRAGK